MHLVHPLLRHLSFIIWMQAPNDVAAWVQRCVFDLPDALCSFIDNTSILPSYFCFALLNCTDTNTTRLHDLLHTERTGETGKEN